MDVRKILTSLPPILFIFAPSLYFGVMGKTTEMGLSITAGCFTCVFLNIDKFAKFKGIGFEGELKKVIEETHIIIEQMRNLIKPLILLTYNLLTHSEKWSSNHINMEYLANNLLKTIEVLSLENDKDIKSAINEYSRFKTWNKYKDFIQSIIEIPQEKTIELYKELHQLIDYSSSKFPNEEEIRTILSNYLDKIPIILENKLYEYLEFVKNNHSYLK